MSSDYSEPRWPAAVAVLAALLLYLGLPQAFIIGPRWLLPVLEGVLLVPLLITDPDRTQRDTKGLRVASILLIALLTLATLVALVLLVHDILRPRHRRQQPRLFGHALWGTNVIIYGLWYWGLDGGGPDARHGRATHERDFLFPARAVAGGFVRPWHPSFFDYLYSRSPTRRRSAPPTACRSRRGRRR